MASVYFVAMLNPSRPEQDFGLVKVGVTDGDVAARIAQLQTGNPYELRCLGSFETSCAFEVEHFIHRTHAVHMHNLEWLRWQRDEISSLIEPAREAARRFEDRKSREDVVRSCVSNGRTRRADREEIRLHRQVRALKYELVPAKLRLASAENQLKAATGSTHGVEGIVRARLIPATIRLSVPRVQSTFPTAAARCSDEEVYGRFTWRRVPRSSRFVTENLIARETATLAASVSNTVLAAGAPLRGWLLRSPELERLHDDFLRTLQIASRLDADLADLRNQLIVKMGDHDAVDPICSYKRTTRIVLNVAAFCAMFPEQAVQCAEPVAAQLRKSVYLTRSYV